MGFRKRLTYKTTVRQALIESAPLLIMTFVPKSKQNVPLSHRRILIIALVDS